MQDNFDDLPSADQETQDGFRKLLEDRQQGVRDVAESLGLVLIDVRVSTMDPIDLRGIPMLPVAVVSPHIDMTALALAEEAARPGPLALMGYHGVPGVGKSYHVSGAERELMEETRFGDYDGYKLRHNPFRHYDYADYRAVDDDRNLPEWQKRRNASATAKQALIEKLKRRK